MQLFLTVAAFLAAIAGAGFVCWRLRRLLMPESYYRVEFDDATITVTRPRRSPPIPPQVVEWEKLDKVTIRTTDGGPWELDLFWVFHQAGPPDTEAVFPGGAPGAQALIKELETRLPGLRSSRIAQAMGSSQNALFVVWQRPEPETDHSTPEIYSPPTTH